MCISCVSCLARFTGRALADARRASASWSLLCVASLLTTVARRELLRTLPCVPAALGRGAGGGRAARRGAGALTTAARERTAGRRAALACRFSSRASDSSASSSSPLSSSLLLPSKSEST